MKKRFVYLDILKLISAFLVVCIHSPFPGNSGLYIKAIARVAVPVFFMISGFFFAPRQDIEGKSEVYLKKQVKKIFFIALFANIIFIIANLSVAVYLSEAGEFLKKGLSLESLFKLIVFNRPILQWSVGSDHLWYLNALLYVYLIAFILEKLPKFKFVYYISPALLLLCLVFGKYSLLLLGKEFPAVLTRNWLLTALPYFSIGIHIFKITNKRSEYLKSVPLALSCMILFLLNLFEHFMFIHFNIETAGDQYLCTILLSVSLVLFFLSLDRIGLKSKTAIFLSSVGSKLMTEIYIFHPLVISCFSLCARALGITRYYALVAPFVVFVSTAILAYMKNKLISSIKFKK